MLRFSLYGGVFFAGVALQLALYGFFTNLWAQPNSWNVFLLLLGCFALGFLTTLCALLDFRGFGKKDVM
jgi:hypothetical protein